MRKAIVGKWGRKPLPTKSVSDNLLVVQLNMAHLEVWRWLEGLYYRLVIELWSYVDYEWGKKGQT